jgi:hypothetical protein
MKRRDLSLGIKFMYNVRICIMNLPVVVHIICKCLYSIIMKNYNY